MKPKPPMTRKARTLRYLAPLVALLLPTAAACGIQPTGITELGQAPAALTASPAQDGLSGSPRYLVFFYQNDRLTAAYRAAKGEVSESTVLEALINGPTQAEQSAGYTSMIPTTLIAKPQANGELAAYTLSEPLGLRAKAQFICTMQYYDQTSSVGIQVADSANVIWNACSDTTSEYVPMRGDQSAVPSVPSPSSS